MGGGLSVTPQAEGRGTVTVSNVTLTGRREDHGRALVCEAATPGLGTRSASVILSVSHPPQALWLEAPPPNATFRVGARVRLGCHARGGHPPPRLLWSKDGRPLKEGPQTSGGSVVTRELLVTVAPSDNGATYRCEASGDPPLSAHTRLRVLCWRGSRCRWPRGPSGGVTAGSRLRLLVAVGDQGQRVTCQATSPALGVTVSAAHVLLVRHPPQFGVGPGTLVVAREHEGTQLPLAVVAHPPVESCVWSLRGRPLRPEGSPRHQLGEGMSLAIANVTRGDAGTYGVECHNAEGTASTRLRLRVHCATHGDPHIPPHSAPWHPMAPYSTL
ncbi:nephrin [Chroicocephalus ridibundus]|uniref:nephrin n=1 Tax=Chroicocephalus ridibundus TaxID=1192867 RepID=UPI002FDCFE05